jgi:putative hydrolase of the HAD superfamily
MNSRAWNTIGNIKGVLFDLDNTLYDRDLTFAQCAGGFVEEHFATLSAETRAGILEQMLTEGIKGYSARQEVFAEIVGQSSTLPRDMTSISTLFFQKWLSHMVLEEDTHRLLSRLEDENIPFGIITNGGAKQHLKIGQLGLRSRTKCLFVSDEFGCNKPDPTIFRAASSCLNVPCESILFVGDNPIADICGAHAVGMTTVWLHRGTDWPASITDVQPDFSIDSLVELLTILPPTE